jgi:hypothetical protein
MKDRAKMSRFSMLNMEFINQPAPKSGFQIRSPLGSSHKSQQAETRHEKQYLAHKPNIFAFHLRPPQKVIVHVTVSVSLVASDAWVNVFSKHIVPEDDALRMAAAWAACVPVAVNVFAKV